MSEAEGSRAAGEPVLLELGEHGVATVTLNRPERLNALNDALLEALVRQLEACREGEARAVVLRGAGRAFCSGHDLKEVAREDAGTPAEETRRSVELTQSATLAMRALECPVVAAVHGYAVGGGAELALSADLLVVAEDATFQFTETAVGLSITNGSSQGLSKAAGAFRAKELVMLGEPFSGERAVEIGLANRAVPADGLEAELAAVVATLLRRAPLALATAKRLLDEEPPGGLDAVMATEVDAAVALQQSADAGEARRAFAERRDPVFEGR